MQKVKIIFFFLYLLPLAVMAQGNRFFRYNCLGNSIADTSVTRASSTSRRLLPTPRTDWQQGRIYRVPFILMEFSDRQFSMENPREFYDRLFNEPGFNLGHGRGCVADYFREQSGGLLNLKFDVVGPIRVDSSLYKSGKNQFREAARKADSVLNYADYDWYGDGSVPQLGFIYAGYGGNENDAKSDGCIWPFTDYINIYVDGVIINNMTCSAELWATDELCGIGTICHEFSHCLGIPDLYPVSSEEFSVLDEWDLMDGGNYIDNGWCPPNYSVHEKELLGWYKAKELTATQTVSGLLPLASGGEAYRITNTGKSDEYYLLENRQQQGWDYFLPGHGLTIIHVDYRRYEWERNIVNGTPNHHRLDFFHASGQNYNYCEIINGRDSYIDGRNLNLKDSAYPFISDTLVANELTDTSVPVAATLFNKNAKGKQFMEKPIKNIQESADGLISFQFFNSVEAGIRVFPDNRKTPEQMYNLHGQRLQAPSRHGLYIVNGRKYVAR